MFKKGFKLFAAFTWPNPLCGFLLGPISSRVARSLAVCDTPVLATFERVSATTKGSMASHQAPPRQRFCCLHVGFAVTTDRKLPVLHVTESHVRGKRPLTFFPSEEIRRLSCHGGRCPGSDKALSDGRGIEALTDPRYSAWLSGWFHFGREKGSGTFRTETVDAPFGR